MNPIEQRIHELEATFPWLVCASGGADSTALLHACARMCMPVVVAHFNFALRGEESNRDEEFVRSTCSTLGIECVVERADTRAYCREHGLSLEMGCRELRYTFFRKLLASRSLRRIAVAHNADDNAETMLLNLLRGTGIKGLTGMSADTGEIIRPLLTFSRASILEYLHSLGATFVTDSSNLSTDFSRNFLRNSIMPALRTRWHGLDKALARTCSHLQDSALAAEAYLRPLLPAADEPLPLSTLRDCASPRALLRLWLEQDNPSSTQVADMVEADPGSRWVLHSSIVEKTSRALHRLPIKPSPLPSLHIESLPIAAFNPADAREDSCLLCADTAVLHVRRTLASDRMHPYGMAGTTPVRKLLKEHGLSPTQRVRFPIVVDAADRPVWLPGVRRSSLYPVETAHSRFLKITLK